MPRRFSVGNGDPEVTMGWGLGKIACVATIGVIALYPGSASAAPPEYPHGAGVCISQLAIEPELAGATSLGALASSVGSGMPDAIDSVRGDTEGGCGSPPGPRHLS